jgi:Uma2 family endonuclease
MSAVLVQTNPRKGISMWEWTPVVELDFGSSLKKMDDDEFFEFCQRNKHLRIEMTKKGDIIIMPPTGTETGGRNFTLNTKFGIWVERDGTGKGFDSSTGFKFPDGAQLSPDLSWIRWEKWNAVPKEKRKKFAPLVPDFVVEIRSDSDSLKKLQKKMNEYIENGVQLGWLIDPTKKRVHIYSSNTEPQVLENPTEVSGEPLLEGFVLNLQEIW